MEKQLLKGIVFCRESSCIWFFTNDDREIILSHICWLAGLAELHKKCWLVFGVTLCREFEKNLERNQLNFGVVSEKREESLAKACDISFNFHI